MELSEYLALDAIDIVKNINNGEISAVEVVDCAVRRLDTVEPIINAFSFLTIDKAYADAEAIDTLRRRGGKLPPFAGVPFSVKDLISVADVPYCFGSKAYAENIGKIDAPSVERLRSAGGLMLGKTTTAELGTKALGDSPLTGVTRNPLDTTKTTGGSSAGAAASIAAGVSPVALGTDAGGSVRIPAAMTGTFAVKPQFGRVPVFPRSATPEVSHIGPMTRSVKDAAFMLDLLRGPDSRDPNSFLPSIGELLSECYKEPRPLRVAWSPTLGYAKADGEMLKVLHSSLRYFESWGCSIEEVESPIGPDTADAWSVMYYACIATNLGEKLQKFEHEIDSYSMRLLKNGLNLPIGDYCKALLVKRALHDHLTSLFNRYDILLTPTTPVASFDIGLQVPPGHEDRNAVTWAYYTYPFNLSGNPAASIPVGSDARGFPVGLQVVTPMHCEDRLFNVCAALERLNPWQKLNKLDVEQIKAA